MIEFTKKVFYNRIIMGLGMTDFVDLHFTAEGTKYFVSVPIALVMSPKRVQLEILKHTRVIMPSMTSLKWERLFQSLPTEEKVINSSLDKYDEFIRALATYVNQSIRVFKMGQIFEGCYAKVGRMLTIEKEGLLHFVHKHLENYQGVRIEDLIDMFQICGGKLVPIRFGHTVRSGFRFDISLIARYVDRAKFKIELEEIEDQEKQHANKTSLQSVLSKTDD